jgi:hypothetical protein
MQKKRELMGLNEHWTDADTRRAIHYFDPDVRAGTTRDDAARLPRFASPCGLHIHLSRISIPNSAPAAISV